MPDKVYLDDNGEPIGASASASSKVYLDDHGGPIGAAHPEGKSLSGFMGNVVSSGGKFLKDTASGLVDAAHFIGDISPNAPVEKQIERGQQAKAMFSNAPRIVSAMGKGLKDRYGGVEQIKNTLYNDPVGVASDVATVLEPAAWGAKAGGFAKTARVLSKAAEVSNPMHAVGAATEAVTGPIANTLVRGTLRPPASVRSDFGGSKAVADAVLKDRVFSEASAQKKLTGSVAQADQMLADAQAAGVPGVPRVAVARSVLGEPQATAKLRTRLGVPDASPELMDTAKAITRNNPSRIPLTDAQALKREAQTLAYEAGVDNQSVKKAAEAAKAQALRAGIEQQVPDVAPINEQSQRLLGSQQAFAAAEDRPRALTNFLSVLGGTGGFAAGGPVGAALTPLLIKAMDSPRAGALAGIGINEFGKGMNAKSLREAALLARLAEDVPDGQ
jgi:hypothetical protein